MNCLERKFETLWRYSACTGDYQQGFQELVVKYNKSKRYYHTFDGHIEFCIHSFFEHVVDKVKNPINVLWQLVLHDSVMDFSRSDEVNCEAREYALGYNDVMSGEYAREFLTKYGVVSEIVDAVAQAIIYYDHKNTPHSTDTMTGLDIDLLILGQPVDIFDEYESNIRKEYAWVEELAFREGRSKILADFLNNRSSIFLTDYFKDRYENQARLNLKRSILQLKAY
ncbi:MAG: hypothetical protein ACKUBY_01980 [Candidatus Moraniibacteriota bacterium]